MESQHASTVVGTGAVGRAFEAALGDLGWKVRTIARCDGEPRRLEALRGCGLVLVCVPDRAIGEAAEALAASLGERAAMPVVLHTSGFHGTGPLAPVSGRGCAVGALHPIASVPRGALGAGALGGATFAFSGDAAARAAALSMVHALGGTLLDVGEEQRTRYHAACALLSNGLVALCDAVWEELGEAGVARADVLGALLRSTLTSSAEAAQPAQALTGPASRGDAEVVAAHLGALADPGTREVYRLLSRRMVAMARARGTLDPDLARAVETALGGE